MRTIITIEGKEIRKAKDDTLYTITTVMTDDGTIAEFYGDDIHVGDQVEVFFHWGKVKCRLPVDKTTKRVLQ